MPIGGNQGMSNAASFGLGAGAGGGAVILGQELKKAKSRGSWALGIGVALLALEAFSSSDLNSDQTSFTALQARAQSLPFSSSVTGLEVAALRSVVADGFAQSAKMAYDANIFAFNGAPSINATPVQIAAYTPTVSTTTSNSNVVVVLIAVLAVVLIVWTA